MSIVELTSPPDTRALYRRAALGLVPRRRPDTLPDTGYVLRGVTVDRAHLAGYDRICGFRLTDTLPATYPHVLAFPLAMRLMTAADFPVPVVGLVHVANHIELLGPLDADARLDLSVRAANLRPHERGQQLDVVATASVNGAAVWRSVSTYLRKAATPPHRDPPPRQQDGPASPGFTARWHVPAKVGAEYARVSGDRNPIHTSRIGARLFGFPRPIAHGMWSKARCLAALDGRLPDRYTVDVAFRAPILLPGRVCLSLTPTGGWTFALHGERTGKPHLEGTIAV